MKSAQIILATLILLSSPVIPPALAQDSLLELELRRRQRDQEQLDVQNQIRYLNAQAAATAEQAEQQKRLILIGVGVLIVGGLGGVWIFITRNLSHYHRL